MHGHFSFNLVGYVAYITYCMTESAKKLSADLDPEPWSWPPMPLETLKVLLGLGNAVSAFCLFSFWGQAGKGNKQVG